MPGGFPVGLELNQCVAQGANTSNSTGVWLAPSQNAKSAWAQIGGNTATDVSWMVVQCQPINGVGATWATAVDIGIGASGSQKVIVNNLVFAYLAGTSTFSFPMSIPANTAIWARSSADNGLGSSNSTIVISVFDAGFPQMEGIAGIDSYGYTAGSTKGTLITSGAADTKGSYVQIGANTSQDYMGLMFGLDPNQSFQQMSRSLLDLAIGAGGSQQVIVPNISVWTDGTSGSNSTSYYSFHPGPYYVNVPANTAIWARWQSNVASTTVNITINGLYL